MAIKGEWAEPCRECGALGACCATAQDRLDTANSLSRLVAAQSRAITAQTMSLAEARAVIEDLRRTA